jgi:hypothetical protein
MPPDPGDWGAWGVPGIVCGACGEAYPVIDGILQMIPQGDLSRYAYWEDLHKNIDVEGMVALYRRRYAYPQAFQDSYYALPRLCRRLGWSFAESLELGCGWGTYSMSLAQSGLTRQLWMLDISLSALKGTRQVFRQLGFEPFLIQGEIHHLPFKDRAFEVSLSGGLYEHFVGDEQQALVAENCRISQRVLNELPESTLAYWAYRKILTWHWGRWPFGFEVPLTRARLRGLYSSAGMQIRGWDRHDLATAALFVAGERWPWLRRFTWRPGIFHIFRHDVVVAVEHG